MGDFAKLADARQRERHRTKASPWTIGRREEMDAYRIDRFGSVDGIVLRSSEDPRPGPKEILMRVRASSLNYRDLNGPQRWGSGAAQARRRAAFRRRGRSRCHWRRGNSGQGG